MINYTSGPMPYFSRIDTVAIMNWLIGTEYLFHRWPCTCAIFRSARDICVHDYTCAIYRSINDFIVSCLRSWRINGCLTWAIRHTLWMELLSTLISFSGVHVAHSVKNGIGSALSFSLSHSLLFIFIALYNM